MLRSRVREAILAHCDGTWPGSNPSLPELRGDDLQEFISAVEQAADVGFSSDTTRKIQTLRRMADRLDKGHDLKDASYLREIADDYERVHQCMLRARHGLLAIGKVASDIVGGS